MKKLLIILGSVFLFFIILAAVGIGMIAMKGSALDKESKAYVDAAVPAIVSNWDEQALASRVSPEFTNVMHPGDMAKLFRMYRQLGKFREYKDSRGQSFVNYTLRTGKVVTAEYTANATFDTGPATITLAIIKHDNQWQIEGFRINSRAFLDK